MSVKTTVMTKDIFFMANLPDGDGWDGQSEKIQMMKYMTGFSKMKEGVAYYRLRAISR